MEPLSAIASAIALGQATKEIGKFSRFVKTLGDIPDDYRDFVKELEETSEVAQELNELVKDHGASFGKGLGKMSEDLRSIAQTLRQLLEDVTRVSKTQGRESSRSTTTISTFRFERKRSEITKLQGRMRGTRDNITFYLQKLILQQS